MSNPYEWWVRPAVSRARRRDLAGAAIVMALYVLCLLAFSLQPSR